jgi:hypothetical protein
LHPLAACSPDGYVKVMKKTFRQYIYHIILWFYVFYFINGIELNKISHYNVINSCHFYLL